MDKIKCAVIGVGYLGKFHAEKYTNLPNAELVAVCDIDTKVCQEIADKYRVRAYADYEKLITEVKPDAISIVVPSSLHYQVAKFCLEHDIHILLEKPMATTVAEADELIAIAKQHDLVLQIGHLERFNPVYLKLRDLVKNPSQIFCSRLAPYKARCTDASVVLELMIHDLDLVYSMVQSPIKNVEASGHSVHSQTLDVVNAYIEFANKTKAHFTASRVNPSLSRQFTILQGNVSFCGDLNEKTLSMVDLEIPANSTGLRFNKNDALLDEITSFVDCIMKNLLPVVSGESSRNALTTALEIEHIALKNLQLQDSK